jgi:exopolysaccharide biosynthesis polyprenyl glycosylphosphotransferase
LNPVDASAEKLGLSPAPPPAPTVEASRHVVRSHYRDRDFALRRMLLLADMLGLWLAVGVAMAIPGGHAATFADALWLLPTLPLWAILFRTYGLYRRPIRRFEPTHLDDVSSLFHALLVGSLGLWLYYKLIPAPRLDFEEVAIFGMLSLPLIAGLRVALRVVNLRRQGPERVFAVAPPEDVRTLRRKLEHHPEYEMALVGAVSCEEGAGEPGLPLDCNLEEVEALLATGQIDHLVVRLDASCIAQAQVQELMHACHREGVRFGCFPGVRTLLLPGTELNHIEGMGILTSNPPILSRTSRAMKRCLDLVVAALLLALFALPMALIALAIKLDSKGSVLYRQTRVGKDGRRFKLFKFRSMVVGADRMDEEMMERSADPDWLVMAEDPRVTRVGRFLRRNSLDELPQLWNVVRGEMSLVGPRPLSERDDKGVHGRLRHRLDLVPGVTGYWQVLGRNNIPFKEMLEVDYAYIASWSAWYDLKLLLRTVPAVIRRRGAN